MLEPKTDVTNTALPRAILSWYSTILLAFLYWFSILDRFIISLLVDPIKKDLGISDVQFGMLHGFSFAITFSLFGFLVGALADRLNRRWIIFASVSVWSIATAACGMAQNFWHMMLARIGVGVGEAGLNPCATSIITDLFPRERLTLAIAIYSMGASVGSGCAYLFGGMIVDWVSAAEQIVLPLVGVVRSWQATFFIVGLPGLCLSLLIFTTPEPCRRGVRTTQESTKDFWSKFAAGYNDFFVFIRSKSRFFSYHYAGFGLTSLIIGGAGSWYPAHMARSFGWSSSQIGLGLGLTLVASGLVGKVLCGRVVDALFSRGFRDAQFRWFAWSICIGIPIGVYATTSANPWVFLVGLGVFYVLMSPMPVCAQTALNLVTPNELRGTGMAFFSGTAGLVGISLGPLLVAIASDYIFGGNAIGYGIALLISIVCPVAALLLFLGMKAMREAVNDAEAWS
jgi:MFS family permease